MPASPAEAIIKLKGSKLALGCNLPDGYFKFSVHDKDGNLVTTGQNITDGDIEFDEFLLFSAGEYYYTITEDALDDDDDEDWSTDPDEFNVKVIVTQNPQAPHGFDVDIEYIDGYPIFKNYYCEPGKGLVEFPCITFTEPGEYKFTIREDQTPKPGWILDNSVFHVTIKVVDDGKGNLVPYVIYENGKYPEFVNEYKTKSICVPLSAIKIAKGAKLQKGQFTFHVFEGDKIVSTATNEAPCK
ncbi:MAG: hypothetical protein FWD34_06285 [Oscillospiraceae bacterium]|nr:hypothetical protein [Oscillospiraceae bacterium]